MGASRTARFAAVGGLAATVAVILYFALGGSDSGHRVSVVVPAAANLVPGQEINSGGHRIGTVTGLDPVDAGRSARIKMRIDDEDYWPLAADTKLELRFGGTVSFSNRYVLLTRGKDRAHLIEENGQLATENVTIPVEVDEFVADFKPLVRRDIKRFLGNSAGVAQASSGQFREALKKAPPVVEGASAMLADLTANEQDLDALLTSTGRVVNSLDRSQPDLKVLLDGLAGTFDAIADESDNLEVSLQRFPAALRQTRRTLATADVTLQDAGELTSRIAPGVEQLKQIAAPLTSTLASVRRTTPPAIKALERHPDIKTTADLIGQGTSVLPQVGSIGKQSTTQLDCVRPYAPEIVLLGTTWADWMSPVDKRDHFVRATAQHFLPAQYNSIPLTAGQTAKLYPGLEYGFPRPPGTLAGQPWYQPQCGAGKDALDPDKDQESANFAENQLPPELRPTSKLKGASK